MCTLLVTQMVACLLPGGELAWFLRSNFLVTETVACLDSDGELALVLYCAFLS